MRMMPSVLLLSLMALSCSPSYGPYKKTEVQAPPKRQIRAEHTYVIEVVTVNGDNLADATVGCKLYENTLFQFDSVAVTPENGKVKFSKVSGPFYESAKDYTFQTLVEYRVSKEGFYPAYGSESISLSPVTMGKTVTVVLAKPTDYVTPGLIRADEWTRLWDRILITVDEVRLVAIISDCRLAFQSVETITFKGNKYFSLGLRSNYSFNTRQSSTYAVASRLFDDIIRKVLEPLVRHLGSASGIYGFDCLVTAQLRDFSNDSDKGTDFEFRFLIRREVATKYKAKDITGQDVINESIVLVDGDRIELRLQ